MATGCTGNIAAYCSELEQLIDSPSVHVYWDMTEVQLKGLIELQPQLDFIVHVNVQIGSSLTDRMHWGKKKSLFIAYVFFWSHVINEIKMYISSKFVSPQFEFFSLSPS